MTESGQGDYLDWCAAKMTREEVSEKTRLFILSCRRADNSNAGRYLSKALGLAAELFLHHDFNGRIT
jgi:hypothetical protein